MGHFFRKRALDEIIPHAARLFTLRGCRCSSFAAAYLCAHSRGLTGRTEEGWGGAVKVEGTKQAQSVCLSAADRAAPPVLLRCSHRAEWAAVPASETMGCGLRKLEDPEDSSPGKIYSTLKRPQVETKTDTVYEYVLLDFSLEGRLPWSMPRTNIESDFSRFSVFNYFVSNGCWTADQTIHLELKWWRVDWSFKRKLLDAYLLISVTFQTKRPSIFWFQVVKREDLMLFLVIYHRNVYAYTVAYFGQNKPLVDYSLSWLKLNHPNCDHELMFCFI